MPDGVVLSIVMPCLLQRINASTMFWQIQEQIRDMGTKVELFALVDNGPMSTGAKVGELFKLCHGEYICRVDDDDRIEDDYVQSLLDAIEKSRADVITFDHTYNIDGRMVALTKQIPNCEQKKHKKKKGAKFSIHDRLPGILCPVRASLARQFNHPDISEKEDYAYKDFLRSNAKTYHNIDRVLYHHEWNSGNIKQRTGLQWMWGRH